MATVARELLEAFYALPAADQHEVAVEILRHSTATDELPEAGLHELALELFRSYDAEEAKGADS